MNVKMSIGELCEKTGMSRRNVDADLAEELVRAERAVQPRLGGKKLHRVLKPALEKAGVRIGRDRFFEVLDERGLLLEPLPKAEKKTKANAPVAVAGRVLPHSRNLSCDLVYGRREERNSA